MSRPQRSWKDPAAQALIERAKQHEPAIAPNAEARVWQQLRRHEERARRRPAWAMFAAGIGCAAAAALVILVVHLNRTRNTALVFHADGAQETVRVGGTLRARGDLPVVELSGAAQLVLGRDAVAQLEHFDGDRIALKIDRGSVLLHVAPRRGREPFLIRTPDFLARVVGTVFRVVVRPEGGSSLTVAHGAVEVTPVHGERTLVRSGESWPALSPDRPEQAELDRLGVGELEGVTLRSFSPALAEHPVDCPSEPNLAVACQLALSASVSGVRAENALYEAGAIAFRDLHDPTRALEIWESLQVRFPHGVLAEEAQASIIDALVALHRTPAAEREVERYLDAHPSGLRAAEMHYVLGTLLRSQDGDCRRARGEIDRALEHPAEPWASQARKLCSPHD